MLSTAWTPPNFLLDIYLLLALILNDWVELAYPLAYLVALPLVLPLLPGQKTSLLPISPPTPPLSPLPL